MRFIRAATGVALLAATATCGRNGFPSEPPPGYSFAIAQRDCGPADGPALSIYLTPALVDAPYPPPPFIRIGVYETPADVVGRTWSWDASSSVAGAVMCASSSDCVTANSGSIAFGRFAADSSLVARMDVRFPDAHRVRGTVRGVWQSNTFLCG
jgi:hypothetical protein